MSGLASNNPFRDRAAVSPRPTTLPSETQYHSKNPFLEAKPVMSRRSEKGEADLPRSERDRSQQARGASRTLTKDDGHSRRKDEHSSSRSRPREALRSSKPDRPTHSSGSVANDRATVRPRSNSETSATNLKKDRADRERRREKEAKSSSSGKPRKHLDKIDLLDVTGFTTAGGFHHDGPFDACTPHRNKNSKKAPVLAFAKDSTAMSLGAGPTSQPVYFGDHVSNVESFADYGNHGQTRPSAVRATSFNTTSNIDPIHGYESYGLGTSTFLEGAPASRSAMARTASDNGSKTVDLRPRATSDYAAGGSGLGRKKSVLQKIRGAYRDRSAEAAEQSVAVSPPSSPYKVTESASDYFSESKDAKGGAAANISFQLTDEGSSTLSPLYRPPSQSAGSGTNGLIRRVKSLRVSGKKRSDT